MAKRKRQKQKSKIPDLKALKSLILGKPPETANSNAHLPGTRGFVPVKDVRDGVIITELIVIFGDMEVAINSDF